jgi:cytochrome c oxidase cbb3-type subunit III
VLSKSATGKLKGNGEGSVAVKPLAQVTVPSVDAEHGSPFRQKCKEGKGKTPGSRFGRIRALLMRHPANRLSCVAIIGLGSFVALLHFRSSQSIFAAADAFVDPPLHDGPTPQAGQAGAPSTAGAEGQRLFAANCGFCHGSDARGGAEGGPNLTRSAIATGDRQRFVGFLKVGRPPRMPAFDLPDAEVETLYAFIKSQTVAARESGASDPNVILVGDAQAGKAYFDGEGKCAGCHSVTGDLRGVGGKYTPEQLQGRMVLARGNGGYPGLVFPGQRVFADKPRTADVTFGNETVSGEVVNVSDYLITLKRSDGSIVSFTRDGAKPAVAIHDSLQAHIDMLPKWTDRNMHDVTAYLVTIK